MSQREIKNNLKDFWKNTIKIDWLEEKFDNINNKTSQKDVPDFLWTQRTHRKNRVLLRWSILKENLCLHTYKNLEKFKNGVCVEFINGQHEEQNIGQTLEELRTELLNKKAPCDSLVCSMISIRDEKGDPGAKEANEYFEKKLIDQNSVEYSCWEVNKVVRCDKYKLHRKNKTWKGTYFLDIKGGNQNPKTFHIKDTKDKKNDDRPLLFNPAIEYAEESVCNDIYIVLSYFALFAIPFSVPDYKRITEIKDELEKYLDSKEYNGKKLLNYCKEHPSLSLEKGKLTDPITMKQIMIKDFQKVEVCHNTPASKYEFNIDTSSGKLLSAASPDNLFWGFRESNLIQREYTLDEYFIEEKNRVDKRFRFLRY